MTVTVSLVRAAARARGVGLGRRRIQWQISEEPQLFPGSDSLNIIESRLSGSQRAQGAHSVLGTQRARGEIFKPLSLGELELDLPGMSDRRRDHPPPAGAGERHHSNHNIMILDGLPVRPQHDNRVSSMTRTLSHLRVLTESGCSVAYRRRHGPVLVTYSDSVTGTDSEARSAGGFTDLNRPQ